jgi:hypothetical protein
MRIADGIKRFVIFAIALAAMPGARAEAAELAPSAVVIAMSFDSPSVPLGGFAVGRVSLSDGAGHAATLVDDLSVVVSCQLAGLVSIDQPQTIPAGASSATFVVEVLDLDPLGLLGSQIVTATGQAGIYGTITASVRVAGLAN